MLGKLDDACRAYSKARAYASSPREIDSMYSQAIRVVARVHGAAGVARVEECFRIEGGTQEFGGSPKPVAATARGAALQPSERRVAALAGRRPDAADAAQSRFPLEAAGAVKERTRRVLEEHSVGTLVCSAACGADLLALDAAGDLSSRRVVILPFGVDRFRSSSVVDRPGQWGMLYDRIIAEVAPAEDLVVLRGDPDDDEVSFLRANQEILTRAAAAAQTDAARPPVAIVVWEGVPHEGATQQPPSFATPSARDSTLSRFPHCWTPTPEAYRDGYNNMPGWVESAARADGR
jgi:hypothetical protein